MKYNVPKLSIVVVFHNMRREAARTLFSLTEKFQVGVSQDDYEVIAIDSNSSEPLDANWVESLQDNYSYHYVDSPWPTPCKALNFGIEVAMAQHLVCMIDGARIISPGVLSKMITANSVFKNPFVQTIAMHLGDKLQNESLLEGYDQKVEDAMLDALDWQIDGYRLFERACLAKSSARGFAHPITESNCFSVRKNTMMNVGGFDERFRTPGGGIVNHDLLNRILECPGVQPVMILGEASFHQFHGGVATNVPLEEHPGSVYLEEYKNLRGKSYAPVLKECYFLGNIDHRARRFLI